MRTRRNMQLARIFGIRIGVSASWFVVLFLLIYWLSNEYFPQVMSGSQTTAYVVAVAGALGYFASLILHELGHALVARRLGIEIVGIDLWASAGSRTCAASPRAPARSSRSRRPGRRSRSRCSLLCLLAIVVLAHSGTVSDVALARAAPGRRPRSRCSAGSASSTRRCSCSTSCPRSRSTAGASRAALVWWRTGDRNRATQATGRSGQAFALLVGLFGLWVLASNGSFLGLLTMLLAFMLYQAAGAAVLQGALGRRIQHITVGDIMDREPVTIDADVTLLDAQEQFFLRYRWPWFAVVDPARHFLGVVRQQRVDSEIAAGRPALPVVDVLEQDLPVRIGEAAPLESLLGSEGLGRLGAMVAVDEDGVLQGVVTLAQVRRALRPAAPARPAT